MDGKKVCVPIWEKYMLTKEEAANYFNIGINKLGELAKNNADADFIFWNGNRVQFKRKLFEEYLNVHNII